MTAARFFILLLFAGLITSCKDFVSKKITDSTVTVLAPADSTITTTNAITFWWMDLEGADNYNIQIVNPSFAAVQILVADTNVTGTKFQMSLSPGKYQWRIRGQNGGGNSKFNVFNLTIDTTTNLSAQLVVPIGPTSALVSGNSSITFSWNPIASAKKYNLVVSTSSSVGVDVILNTTSYTSTFSPGDYTWKVKALNDFSLSQFNTPKSFKIDQSAPTPPNSLATSNLFTSNTKVADTLKWQRTATDVNYDSLYIYSDAAFTSLNTSTVLTSVKLQLVNLFSVPTQTAAYWWRLKSVDSVGNRSSYSSSAAFTLTP